METAISEHTVILFGSAAAAWLRVPVETDASEHTGASPSSLTLTYVGYAVGTAIPELLVKVSGRDNGSVHGVFRGNGDLRAYRDSVWIGCGSVVEGPRRNGCLRAYRGVTKFIDVDIRGICRRNGNP